MCSRVTIERPSSEAKSTLAKQPNAAAPKVLGLAGWSGSGKTTLLLALVPLLRERGLRVATLKHAHHGFDVDQPGKDSFAHREAGAEQVLVASSQRIALMVEAPLPDPEARRSLEDLLPRLGPTDVVLVEGFKTGPQPKIEVCRPETDRPRLASSVPGVFAVASPGGRVQDDGLLALDLDRPEDWIDTVLTSLHLGSKPPGA